LSFDLDELRERIERIQSEVQALADTLHGEANGTSEPSHPSEPEAGRPHDNPLRQTELAAACREAGLVDKAVEHAVRAADTLLAAGCRREARDSLEDSTAGLEGLSIESLEELSWAWEQVEEPFRAASFAVEAAEAHRVEGQLDRAVALCHRARWLDRDAERVHRTWAFALLAEGDPDGALGHIARWRREDCDDIEPCVWHSQVLLETGDTDEAMRSIRELAARLGLPEGEGLPIPGLRERVVERVDLSPYSPEDPFWENEAIVGSPEAASDEAPAAEDSREEADSEQRQPRVFISQDTEFHRIRLSEILTDENIEVLRCSAVEGVLDRLRREQRPVDLLILPLPAGRNPAVDLLSQLREISGMKEVPILAVATLDRSGVDLDQLQSFGVVGLIDKNAIPEQVGFRVNNLVRPDLADRRRHDRAPTYFAVDLEASGTITTEYATNLSCGGLSVLSSRPVASGVEVTIRFSLASAENELIEVAGRVVRSQKMNRNGKSIHRLGIAFEPLEPHEMGLLEAEVERLLSDAQL
jgi:DNA-binding response OmpR family regulator/tetratricopeptide (TPR) repeat protein